jgi:hypothetical protein
MSPTVTFPVPNVHALTSEDLERYVAGIFQSNGYYVKNDLWWSETLVADTSRSVDILQADILAYFFSPFGENTILIECKGGGNFNDFFKFIGIIQFLKPDSAFFICNNSPVIDELIRLGIERNVKVFRPINIIETFSSATTEDKINLWYWSNSLQASLLSKDKIASALSVDVLSEEQKLAYAEIRKYNTMINGKLWKSTDPRNQANALSAHFKKYKGFVRKILKIQKLTLTDTENAIATNILCESAACVILKAKVEYLTIAVRCAIASLVSTDTAYLTQIEDANFRSVVQKLIDDIQIACRLPQFLQFWIYQFGGLLNENNNEILKLAEFLNERKDTIQTYFTLLTEVFSILTTSGSITWGLHKRGEILEFNAMPDSIRAYGLFFRETHSIDTSGYIYQTQWFNRLKLFL